MAAIDREDSDAVIPAPAGIQALMRAALALPILAVPAKAGAAQVGEMGFTLLGYKEQGLMKVVEPVLWGRAEFAEVWEVRASALVDIISGASPQLVSNREGTPVQTLTGASVKEERKAEDIKVTRRFGDYFISASGAFSDEHDYRSRAYGIEARGDFNERNTTLIAGYGRSNDRVGSHDNPKLDEPRNTDEYLVGITQVVSPTALVQSTLNFSRGRGFYNDPYKLTFTFFDTGVPIVYPDTRPDHRNSLAWLTRYRQHFPAAGGTLQVDYRFYRDDWGIRAHTLEAGWQQQLGDHWSLRPALRYYTQSSADFYSAVVPSRPPPAVLSSDQRLSAFGGLSPSLRAIYRFDNGITTEGTVGYIQNASSFRLGGSGNPYFETLRATYVIIGITYPF